MRSHLKQQQKGRCQPGPVQIVTGVVLGYLAFGEVRIDQIIGMGCARRLGVGADGSNLVMQTKDD